MPTSGKSLETESQVTENLFHQELPQNNRKNTKGHLFKLSIALNILLCVFGITVVLLYLAENNELDKPNPLKVKDNEDFYMCLPCEPMTAIEISEDEFKYHVNGTTMCCKKSNEPLKVPNKGDILSACHRGLSTDFDTKPAVLLYVDLYLTKHRGHDGVIRWMNVNNSTSYIKGGAQYDRDHGLITVPHNGLYVVYSYLQLDTYTVDKEKEIHRMAPLYHSIVTGSNQIIQLNKFMLFPNAFTYTQIGPVIVHLNKGDTLMVATNGHLYLYNDQMTSLFGLYQLS